MTFIVGKGADLSGGISEGILSIIVIGCGAATAWPVWLLRLSGSGLELASVCAGSAVATLSWPVVVGGILLFAALLTLF